MKGMVVPSDSETYEKRFGTSVMALFCWIVGSIAFGFWMESFAASLAMLCLSLVAVETINPSSGIKIKIIPALDENGNVIPIEFGTVYQVNRERKESE